MPYYIQIEGDPTKWWIAEQLPTNELTGGQPLTVTSLAPIEGILVLSPRVATVAAFNVPPGRHRHLWVFPEESSMCRPRPARRQDMSGMSWRAMSTR